MGVGVFRAVFIFMLFVSHLVASNCCALATFTGSGDFCPDHCVAVGESEKSDAGKDGRPDDLCVLCPSHELKKTAMPDDVPTLPVFTPVADFGVCLCLALILQESESVPLPKISERLESVERRWHFITRASGWSRAPSCRIA